MWKLVLWERVVNPIDLKNKKRYPIESPAEIWYNVYMIRLINF